MTKLAPNLLPTIKVVTCIEVSTNADLLLLLSSACATYSAEPVEKQRLSSNHMRSRIALER